ncbi:MAG: phospholipase D-like domain-containing protein [Acidobacteriota bacterium]|nr:phospholipase D-like domain-containing protein [Acidobacteriota bacterium]
MRERIEELLRETLGRVKFSRAEKQTYSRLLNEIGDDRRMLSAMRETAFDMVREHIQDGKDRALLNWLEDVVKMTSGRSTLPQQSGTRAFFGPGCRDTIVQLLKTAERSLDICVFTITDNRLSREIVAAAARGVAVRIISDDDKAEDIGSDVADFARQGIPVRVDETHHHMHHKFTLVDGEKVLTGSYNWTRSASDFNDENMVVISDMPTVRAFEEEFAKLWESLIPYKA